MPINKLLNPNWCYQE